MSKQIPILFSTSMVRAILEGRKTMTRRVMKIAPTEDGWLKARQGISSDTNHKVYSCTNITTDNLFRSLCLQFEGEIGTVSAFHQPNIKCPYGAPGDIIWVRESWFKSLNLGYVFKATPPIECQTGDWVIWKPSIHMPKDAARIWLEVTGVRVERLQDIEGNPEDALAEGIFSIPHGMNGTAYHYKDGGADGDDWICPEDAFAGLWKSINGIESWDANPWVWVIEFKVLSTTGKPDTI